MRFPLGPEALLRYQDRILYGLDFPNILFEWEAEIEILKSYGLGNDFYQKVFYQNGLKLLKELGDL